MFTRRFFHCRHPFAFYGKRLTYFSAAFPQYSTFTAHAQYLITCPSDHFTLLTIDAHCACAPHSHVSACPCEQLAGVEVEQNPVHLVREGGEQFLPSYRYRRFIFWTTASKCIFSSPCYAGWLRICSWKFWGLTKKYPSLIFIYQHQMVIFNGQNSHFALFSKRISPEIIYVVVKIPQ